MAEQSYSVRENHYDSSKPEDAEKLQQGAPAGNFALRRARYFEGAGGPVSSQTAVVDADKAKR